MDLKNDKSAEMLNDEELDKVIGGVRERLDYTSSNLMTSSENVHAAESTFRNADMAKEMSDYNMN